MAKNILQVETKVALEALVNHENGEVAFCNEDQTYYMYNTDHWEEMPAKMTAEGLEINLYDLNKQIISQLPPFDIQRITDAKETLEHWQTENTPYLMYGKEISYFTLFYPAVDEEEDSLVDCVFDCLLSITDAIYSFDIVSDNAIEIWIKYEDSATALYLFDYSGGMVYYHG